MNKKHENGEICVYFRKVPKKEMSLNYFTFKRRILALATIILCLICQHLNTAEGMMRRRFAENNEIEEENVGIEANDAGEIDPNNDEDAISEPMDEQIPWVEQPLPSFISMAEQRNFVLKIFDALLGKTYNKYISHDRAIKGLEKKIAEIVEQMMFAMDVDQLAHLKEVMKMVLFMMEILIIIKKNKEKTKHNKDHTKSEKKTANRDSPLLDKMLELVEKQFGKAIKGQQKELRNLREGQRTIKADLTKIKVAEEDKDWCFLEFVVNRNSNVATYNNAVNDWLIQTLNKQPAKEVDKWDFANGHLNKRLISWKMVEAVKNNESSNILPAIKNDPAIAATTFYPESLDILRVNSIMDFEVRKKFVFVVTEVMRNYAAISEAMGSEEINFYLQLFQQRENGFHTAIECKMNADKMFNNSFDNKSNATNNTERQVKRSNSKSATIGQTVKANFVYAQKSAEWHAKHIKKIIDQFAYKTLMAPTREERIRAMEVLKMAVFLREFHNQILPQNPDDTIKKQAQNDIENCQHEKDNINTEIRKIQTQIDELALKHQIVVQEYNSAKANEQFNRQARMAQERNEREAEELRQAQEAQEAAEFPPVPPVGYSSSEDESGSVGYGSNWTNARHGHLGRRQKRMDGQKSLEELNDEMQTLDLQIKDAGSKLIDLKSQRDIHEKNLEKAKKEYEKAEENYAKGKKKAKEMLKDLDMVREGKLNFRQVIEKIQSKPGFDDDKDGKHYFKEAFNKLKGIKLQTHEYAMPKYVTDDWHVRPARTEEKLHAIVAMEARNELQPIVSKVIINYAVMSREMTAHEVLNCAGVLNWFHEVEVELDLEKAKSNGVWKNEMEDSRGYGGNSSWARLYDAIRNYNSTSQSRRMKGTVHRFVDDEDDDNLYQQHLQHNIAESTQEWSTGEGALHDDDVDTVSELAPSRVYSELESGFTDTEIEQHSRHYPHNIGKQFTSDTETAVTDDHHQQRFTTDSESQFYSNYDKSVSNTSKEPSTYHGYTSTTETASSSHQLPPSNKTSFAGKPPKPKGRVSGRYGDSETDTSASDGIFQQKEDVQQIKFNHALSRRTIKKSDTTGADGTKKVAKKKSSSSRSSNF